MKTAGRILALTLLLTVLLTAQALGQGAEALPGFQRDVVVLFTSDVHCGADQNFTFAGLQAIRETAEAAGNQVLLVDDGDAIQGEAIGLLTTGRGILELMNAMKYDVVIPGNHEFDYGTDRFLQLAGMAEFPYISCNFNREGELVFPAYFLKELEGVKIGFVGVTTPTTLVTSTPRFFQDEEGNYIYGFMEDETGDALCAAIQKAVDDVRAAGADYVILLAHLGNEYENNPYNYADVIGRTTGINAMLDGHSHDTDKAVVKNKDGEPVVRQACGTKMACIGWLRISAETGLVDTGLYTWNNEITAPALLGIRNEMSARLEALSAGIKDSLSHIVGYAGVAQTINDPHTVDENGIPIRIIRRAETNLGDLCADLIRHTAGADVGLINGGNIRAGIAVGEISVEDILSVFPFGNHMCMVEATGQQILNALEYGVSSLPGESGGFLHVSGLTYEIHTYLESSARRNERGIFTGVEGPYRVKNVMVGGEPLDLEKTYTVAAQDYTILDQGDGQSAFAGDRVLWKSENQDYVDFIHYIQETLNGTIAFPYENPYGEGRIVAVESDPALAPAE